ncbi:two-component regulator propeller domain-containing protein [Oxalobacteraceae bacterium A2-2]
MAVERYARRWFILVWLWLPGSLLAAPGQQAPTPAVAMHHVAWAARDGAPQSVLTMAQTADGWLWLGSPNGLFRFDGVRFERYAEPSRPLPAASISILSAQSGGALWIGYRNGGVSVLTPASLRNYSDKDGLPPSAPVWGLEPDASGRMWAATSEGMYSLAAGRWQPAGADTGLPFSKYKTLMRDRDGNLWAQGGMGVFKLAPGASRFVQAIPEKGTGVLFHAPDGSVWSWNALYDHLNRITAPAHGTVPQEWHIGGEVASMLFDSHGDVWVGRPDGISYYGRDGAAQHSGPEQGLSGRRVAAIFEDREGNVWIATATGIDRFRRQRIAAVAAPEVPDDEPLAAGPGGAVWIGRHLVPPPGRASSAPPTSPSFAFHNMTTSGYLDPDGVLWLGGYGGFWRKDGALEQRLQYPSSPERLAVNSMVRGPDGMLWVALLPNGLYRYGHGGQWQRADGDTLLPGESPRVLAASAETGMWLGYPRSRVLQWRDGHWRLYGPEHGLAVGMAAALHLRGAHVWVGGENGLALLHGGRFITLRGGDGQRFEGITGIVELANGDVWLNAAEGLFRLPAQDIARLQAAPVESVRYERLDSLDGLSGSAAVRTPTPSLVEASDGHLWVSTTTGVFRLDPMRRPPPTPSTPVLIRGLGYAGKMAPPQAGMRLAPGTSALQIDYTALFLAIPERVGFRYRLQGVDQDWQYAGERRSAYYSNLGPGQYRFQVMASGYDGAWPADATTLELSIAPTLTQSWWFRALCALVLFLAGLLAYRRRMASVAARLTERLEARTQERERIARELHDTLLQSVQGLVLHVHAAARRLPGPEPVRGMIETALQQADDVMREGRDRVRDLRSEGEPCDLAAALEAAGARMRPPDAPALQVRCEGRQRPLRPAVHEEVLAIACEAIANAYRHAQAGSIEVLLHYGRGELRVCVHDDGQGIEEGVLAAGGRQGHWGMRGMRERAARIKAKLALHSSAGSGTEWRLTLPGVLAYQPAPDRLRWLRPRWPLGRRGAPTGSAGPHPAARIRRTASGGPHPEDRIR